MSKKNTCLILGLITSLGFALRLSFFMGSRFPLHDGGFFYVMVQDLISNKFALPAFSSYNQANIPFIYPPLGLYLAGIIEHFSGASRFQLFRIIPLGITTLTIPAFYIFAKEAHKKNWAALASAAVYSLLPFSFMWLILGGGVTRAFGAFFGMLALAFAMRFIGSGGWKAMIMASMLSGLTVLLHPEWAWFLFYSIGFYVVIKLIAGERKILLRPLQIFLGTAAVILPWLITIFQRHGRSVFLPLLDSGFSGWEGIIKLFLLEWSGEALFPVFTLLSIIGIFMLAKKKEWFAVFWLPLVFVLQGRAAAQKAVLPLALTAGFGITAVFNFLKSEPSINLNLRKITIISLGITAYALIGSLILAKDFIKPLAEPQLESIKWIRQKTAADSKILVISGKDWIFDNFSEWMAALTGRNSVSVVQGYEWLPGFSDRISRYDLLQYEYSKGMADLVVWIERNGLQVDYLVLPKGEAAGNLNWASEAALHWREAQLFPGAETSFENESVLILDLRKVFYQ